LASVVGLLACLLLYLLLRRLRRHRKAASLLQRTASFVPPIQLKRMPTRAVIAKPFDVFLSYRVASDKASVEALYHALKAEGLSVWWDKECLKTGLKWEEGFMDGLLESVVAVPLLSCALLRSMAKLKPGAQDNVLIEHGFCLELFARGELKGVVPLLIGVQGPSTYSDFFAARVEAGSECVLPDVVLPSVNGLLKKHMRRKDKGVPVSKAGSTATVREIVGELLEFQGVPLRGEAPPDFALAASLIAKLIRDIKSRPNKTWPKMGMRSWRPSTARMTLFASGLPTSDDSRSTAFSDVDATSPGRFTEWSSPSMKSPSKPRTSCAIVAADRASSPVQLSRYV